jgi:hypothetical protein
MNPWSLIAASALVVACQSPARIAPGPDRDGGRVVDSVVALGTSRAF